MADYSMTSSSEAFGLQFDRRAGQIRVALPGIIRSFDPASQTVSAQPALKMKVNLGEGEIQQRDYPVIQNVPLVLPFAQGAGLLLTLPLKAGDECLLVFADRALDFFTQSGGIQAIETSASPDTTTPRSHHLTDAICIPGIISNPQAVPDYNAEHIELRDRERKQYFSLGPDGITITDGAAVWNMKDGQVTLNAPAGISYSTPQNMDVRSRNMDLGDDNRVLGDVWSVAGTFTDTKGVALASHTHNSGSQPDRGGAGVDAAPHDTGALKQQMKSLNEKVEEYGETFALMQDGLDPRELTNIDNLLLCLPDREEHMATRQIEEKDARGWLIVQAMHHKWFSGPASTDTSSQEPFWVDWDWVMSFPIPKSTYLLMASAELSSAPPPIINKLALGILSNRLKERKLLTSKREVFDFINEPWPKWANTYQQYRVVRRALTFDKETLVVNGLTAAMGEFVLRAMASGWVDPLPGGGHRIHVSQVAVYVYDVFNFDGKEPFFRDDQLVYWDCEEKIFSLNPTNWMASPTGRFLRNGDFRSFRNRHGIGSDFLVLSKPHLVENFTPIEYDYA